MAELASPSGGTTVPVPAEYQSYVTAAAKTLGIPADVVAAQIQLESDWNPGAVSPAGAEGIAQFEPGTFADWGTGSPFDVPDAFAAYTAYMGHLLSTEGGNLVDALEAYNAGPGDLSAGSSYATTILSTAGISDSTTASTTTNTSSGGLLDIPSEITGFFTKATDDLAATAAWFSAFTRPSTYVRAGAGVFGAVFLILGIVCLGFAAKEGPAT